MAVIETKYSIGDVVWHAGTTTEVKQHPCPDCLGSRKWEAKSPAGGVFEVGCPRCASAYQGNRALNLQYSIWAPYAARRTVGQVRACVGRDGAHEYMCHETGIGSGTIYGEDRLFETEAEALRHAQSMADAANADASGWVAKQYSATAKFCDYQLKDAAIEAAEDRARQQAVRVQILIEDIEEAEDAADAKAIVERWRERMAEAA